ncbi:MAG: site-2 protease family protein [Acidimicrobiia bacterium]|nr:site-2 protease family protein [Acidimicrobiia bacterium]
MPGAVVFLAILSTLVVLHEGAHLSTARRAGIHCSEFAMGFGPRVAAVRVDELVVAIRLFPAGGFVKVTGMTGTKVVPAELETRTYRAAPLRSKLAVVLAGPMANLALGLGLAVIAFGPLTPAAERTDNPVGEAAVWTGSLFTTSFEGYLELVRSVDDYPEAIASQGADGDATRVMSPVAAAQLAGQASDAGIVWVALFASIVSVALGAFNLVPIVPLDGGQGAVAVIEAVGTRLRGRTFVVPAAATKATAFALLGFLLLSSASATYLDVVDPYANPFSG